MTERGGAETGVLAVLGGLILVFAIGALVGYSLRGSPSHTASEQLQAGQIGNVAEGRELFTKYNCVACHSYRGRGGSDGPPLDSMRGQMSAQGIADMGGMIWNHVPQMVGFFRREHLKFPTFSGNQMGDLIAYLHGGGAPPALSTMHGRGMQQRARMGNGGM